MNPDAREPVQKREVHRVDTQAGQAGACVRRAAICVQWAGMKPAVLFVALASLGLLACGSVTSVPDGGGTAGSSAGSNGQAGRGGTSGDAGAPGGSGGAGGAAAGGRGGGAGGAGGRGGARWRGGARRRGGSGASGTRGAAAARGAAVAAGSTVKPVAAARVAWRARAGGRGGAGGVAGAAGGSGGQGGGSACGQNNCVNCCTTMTPGGPAAYYTKMYECACSEPCYSQACKASCDGGGTPPPACIACVRANVNASQFCQTDATACSADANCKAYSACLFASCP